MVRRPARRKSQFHHVTTGEWKMWDEFLSSKEEKRLEIFGFKWG
jgi:hypothetical protein